MAAKDEDKKALWVGWTHDALIRYSPPDDVEDADELVDDMVEASTKYADAMLEEFEERFSGGRNGGARKIPTSIRTTMTIERGEADEGKRSSQAVQEEEADGVQEEKEEILEVHVRDTQVRRVRQARPQRTHLREVDHAPLHVEENRKEALEG